MLGIRSILVLLMVVGVHLQKSTAVFTTYNITTIDEENLTKYLNANKTTCDSAPVTRLNLCNNTCVTCLAGDSSKCASCATGYYLDGTNCMVNQTNYNYSYYTYIGLSRAEASTSIAKFRYTSSNATLDISSIVSICKLSTYDISVAGVFTPTQVINLQFYRTDPIDQIQIKLNFVSLVESIAFYITLNDNVLFGKTFPSMSLLAGVLVQNDNPSNYSYLSLDALSATSASSIFLPIDTNLVNYITNQYTIKFYVKTNGTRTHIWAFNDVVIFQRDCQTCVTQAVSKLMNSTSLSVLYTLIVVVILVILLCMAMEYEQFERKRQFQAKLGTTSGNLPIKAIDRVVDAVKKAQRIRDKEMNKEARDYATAVKQHLNKVQNANRLSKAASKSHSMIHLEKQ